MDAACIDYKDTGFFSQTVIDYLEDAPALRLFYGFRPDFNGFAEFLKTKKVVAKRNILCEVLSNHQYNQEGIIAGYFSEAVTKNISLLQQDNTYTITTGHQLNIFAGPLYFIYKIVTANKILYKIYIISKIPAADKIFIIYKR